MQQRLYNTYNNNNNNNKLWDYCTATATIVKLYRYAVAGIDDTPYGASLREKEKKWETWYPLNTRSGGVKVSAHACTLFCKAFAIFSRFNNVSMKTILIIKFRQTTMAFLLLFVQFAYYIPIIIGVIRNFFDGSRMFRKKYRVTSSILQSLFLKPLNTI